MKKNRAFLNKSILFYSIFRVSVPGHYGSMNATLAQLPAHLTPWERFCIEFVLTCVVVFAYFVSMNSSNIWFGSTSCLGSAYFACGLVSVSNELRTLKQTTPTCNKFIVNKWNTNSYKRLKNPQIEETLSGA